MKRVLTAIAATFGFVGLATLAIFFVETATTGNYRLPGNPNLTANISVNNPLNQLADAGATVANDAGAGAGTATASTTAGTDTAAQADPPPVLPDPSVAQGAITPLPTLGASALTEITQVAPPSTTVATATVTVTPTAPAPPLTTPPTAPPAGTGAGAGTNSLALPYTESNFSGDQNWQASWGALNTTWSGALDLSAGTGSTGGAAYLKNSASWANYAMNATLDWIAGQSFGLIANYVDASNYVLCKYTKSAPGEITIQLLQYVNGYQAFLTPGTAVAWDGNGSGIDASIKVAGAYGTCSFKGQTISNDTPGPGVSAMNAPGSGGIGFTVNDAAPASAEVVIKSVNVTKE